MKHINITSALRSFLVLILLSIGAFFPVSNVRAEDHATLTLSYPTPPMPSKSVRVSSFDGARMVPLEVFNVTASGGDCKLTYIEVDVNWTTEVRTLYLFEGNTLLSSVIARNGHEGNFMLENLDIKVLKDSTRTFMIKGDFEPQVISTPGTYVRTYVRAVDFKRDDGTSGFTQGLYWSGDVHFFPAMADFQLAKEPKIKTVLNQNGPASVLATFTFQVAARGANLKTPRSEDFKFTFYDVTDSDTYPATSIATVTIPNNDIADGSDSMVEVHAMLSGAMVNPAGLYVAKVTRITWNLGSAPTPVYQNWGLEQMVTGISNIQPSRFDALEVLTGNVSSTEYVMMLKMPPIQLKYEHTRDFKTWESSSTLFGSDILVTLIDGSVVYRAILSMPKNEPHLFFRARRP